MTSMVDDGQATVNHRNMRSCEKRRAAVQMLGHSTRVELDFNDVTSESRVGAKWRQTSVDGLTPLTLLEPQLSGQRLISPVRRSS